MPWRVHFRHKYQRWPSCHTCSLKDAGHLLLSVWFFRSLGVGKLTGSIPVGVSALANLTYLYALHSLFKVMLIVKVTFFQESWHKLIQRQDPITDLSTNCTNSTVCPQHSFQHQAVVFLAECHGIFRYLDQNSFTGTIPLEMSALTQLAELYAPSSDPFIDVWLFAPLSHIFAQISALVNLRACVLLFCKVLVEACQHFVFLLSVGCSFRCLSDTEIQPPSCRQDFTGKTAIQQFFRTCAHGMITATQLSLVYYEVVVKNKSSHDWAYWLLGGHIAFPCCLRRAQPCLHTRLSESSEYWLWYLWNTRLNIQAFPCAV